MSQKTQRLGLVVVVIAFLIGAVLLSKCSTKNEQDDAKNENAALLKKQKEEVRYPRDTRRMPLKKSTSPLATQRAKPIQIKADPIVAAMGGTGGTVYMEVNAIRHTALVEKILECKGQEFKGGLDKFKESTGIDPLQDVDRIAISDGLFSMSGNFSDEALGKELLKEGGTEEAYGDNATIYSSPDSPMPLARIGNGLIVSGESTTALKAAIDRAEGRTTEDVSVPQGIGQSEIYGNIGPSLLEDLAKDNPLLSQLSEVMETGTVRMNVDENVSASIDMAVTDAEKGRDLSKAIGGAFALARREAEKSGDMELAALLEQARVLPNKDGSFGVDVAMPGDTVLTLLGCSK